MDKNRMGDVHEVLNEIQHLVLKICDHEVLTPGRVIVVGKPKGGRGCVWSSLTHPDPEATVLFYDRKRLNTMGANLSEG
jgi:hypothetical protein